MNINKESWHKEADLRERSLSKPNAFQTPSAEQSFSGKVGGRELASRGPRHHTPPSMISGERNRWRKEALVGDEYERLRQLLERDPENQDLQRQLSILEERLSLFDFGEGPMPAHKHPNGGGWVSNDSTVPESVFVSEDSKVYGGSVLGEYVEVLDGSVVYDSDVGARVIISEAVVDGEEVSPDAIWYGGEISEGEFEQFFRSYVETALWAEVPEYSYFSEGMGEEYLDMPGYYEYDQHDFDQDDIDAASLQTMREEAEDFLKQAYPLVRENLSRAGHDFDLTRNHHGAGFWDGEWGKYGDRLTDLSHPYGELSLWPYWVEDEQRWMLEAQPG